MAGGMENRIADEIRWGINLSQLNYASNYTQDATVDGVEWHYHSETEPHVHRDASEQEWAVEFAYFNPAFRFVFRHGGKLHSVLPKIGRRYAFDCRKRHAVVRVEDVGRFNELKYWKERFPDGREIFGPLACVFRFV